MTETKWMTYVEMAEAMNLTLGSARTLAKRRRWPRKPGNDGLARIEVPFEEIEKRNATGSDPSNATGIDRKDDTRSDPVAILISKIENAYETQISDLKSERDYWRDKALRPWWRRLAG